MVSTIFRSPILWPARRCAACGASDMFSWPPATMMVASPVAICCMPRQTARRPEPQTWFSDQAVFSFGTPAPMAAWRAGFMPCAAVSTWPRITSSTSPALMPARSMAPVIATVPRSEAGVLANAPLKAPTGVRAPLAMTIESWLIGVLRVLDGTECAGRRVTAALVLIYGEEIGLLTLNGGCGPIETRQSCPVNGDTCPADRRGVPKNAVRKKECGIAANEPLS